ncbi:hypothetical protein M2306_002051 [Myroides gitamensis]|uniref:hypothetical protein n=1 Tax=Myroides odoratus TaxID=256 RepID=UPI0021688244|nr:hypothetical protein [Myroides odoratus]MCS4239510.1 hypothetical protein [Myroides odoratus]MDH6601357.1 hypothetical protein [Myroides gitamensis]
MSQDKHLIIEKDGYPLQIESVQTLNDASQQALTSIAAVCGSNTILQGCNDYLQNGITYISDGIVCIDGRIFQFKGGLKTGGVTIITDKVDDVYDTGDGSAKQMLPVRGFSYVTNSAQGSVNINWDSFVRVDDLLTLQKKVDKMFKKRILFSETKRNLSMPGGMFGEWLKLEIVFPQELPNDDYAISCNLSIDTMDVLLPDSFKMNIMDRTNKGFKIAIVAVRQEAVELKFNIDYIIVQN